MQNHRVFLIMTLLCLPVAAYAQTENFVPLVGIPGLEDTRSTQSYVQALYVISIAAAALLAVVRIIAAGVKYMFSEIPSVKSDAKGDIWGALLGLVIIIGAITILETINPNLTTFNILQNARQFEYRWTDDAARDIIDNPPTADSLRLDWQRDFDTQIEAYDYEATAECSGKTEVRARPEGGVTLFCLYN